MIVRVLVPRALAEFAGGRSELSVEVESATVRDVVSAVEAAHPALARRIVNLKLVSEANHRRNH